MFTELAYRSGVSRKPQAEAIQPKAANGKLIACGFVPTVGARVAVRIRECVRVDCVRR
jgi:hypothetical protein